jgi:hypothetical protein
LDNQRKKKRKSNADWAPDEGKTIAEIRAESGLKPLSKDELEWRNPLDDFSEEQRRSWWAGRLKKDDWLSRENNPHIDQAFIATEPTHHPEPSEPFCRVLKRDAPRKKYERRKGQKKTVIHWGQRKLLFSEIEFLTVYAPLHATVVYAGAAPGTHVAYLCDLFPTLKFVLVDPEDFTVKESPRVTIRQEFFTDTIAREYADRKV